MVGLGKGKNWVLGGRCWWGEDVEQPNLTLDGSAFSLVCLANRKSRVFNCPRKHTSMKYDASYMRRTLSDAFLCRLDSHIRANKGFSLEGLA